MTETIVRVAVTLGDPAGIGPEVTEAAVRALDREGIEIHLYGPSEITNSMSHRVGAQAHPQVHFNGPRGEPSAASGKAALAALYAAIEDAKVGGVDALVTAPLSKEALAMAGCKDRGHTWILARELGDGPVAMAFLGDRLRVVLATDHIPLRQVLDDTSPERILEVAQLLSRAISNWTNNRPRLALAALNPHAGEAGLMGTEERELLQPAIDAAKSRNIDLQGPFPADTLFRRALDGEFDGVVALYHDQALIPVKLLGLGASVNVTLGLRVPRTSPDHGTAYDRVARDDINAAGMLAALRMAIRLAR
ncbi:MAG: 4-hydroxythreonine-4-phosphate dehydrogenase PdxA [Deltaproteobacteria bacterium RIFOXYA12_FULL_58_15]|nr:MAG: 4-hydroxythreonine-4-phosphate dehydrogenase PdxA [Deltaproteobacteria bacterium RIFOXYA12_FULL_58_15]OGR14657.1 MAG: 4-hydroxythreonine-4-phosphate dehydrogenase PdxA [Deltaproteobacteria bacterium RIFOXYB12_FULL_58_9]